MSEPSNAHRIIRAVERLTRYDKSVFTAEEIVVAAWQNYPEIFCLKGFPKHPDSNRVLACLMGRTGLVSLGYLRRVGPRLYSLGLTRLPQELPAARPRPPETATSGILPVKQAPIPPPIKKVESAGVSVKLDNEEETIDRFLNTAAATFLRDGQQKRLDEFHLIECLVIVYPAAAKRPAEALVATKKWLNLYEAKYESTTKLRLVRNILDFLVEQFQRRLESFASMRSKSA